MNTDELLENQRVFQESATELAGDVPNLKQRLLDISADAHIVAAFYFELISLGVPSNDAIGLTHQYFSP